MADIGATLREARMRAKIDISEVEAETKIRAKYLRALENEEWALLPGATFVKTFMRTYADYLGLDSKLLIEEYKLRYEPVSSTDVPPLGTPLGGRRDRVPPPGPPRALIAGALIVALLVVLAVIGSRDDEKKASQPATNTSPTATSTTPTAPLTKPKPRQVRLQIVPKGPVYVCLLNANGTQLIGGRILQPGADSPTFRSRRFRMTLGNGQVELRINGRVRAVRATSSGVAYELTAARGRVLLPEGKRPTCA